MLDLVLDQSGKLYQFFGCLAADVVVLETGGMRLDCPEEMNHGTWHTLRRNSPFLNQALLLTSFFRLDFYNHAGWVS